LPSNYKDKAPRIIVKFDSRLLKISFRKGCKEKRVTIQDMNEHLDQKIDSDASIYVNEHLTREQSVIFYHVRQFKAQRNYKYAWTRDGIAFLRRDDGAQVHEIRSEGDIEALKDDGGKDEQQEAK
jgi:hypothetical protein